MCDVIHRTNTLESLFLSQSNFLNQLKGRLAIVEGNRVRFRPPLVAVADLL